MPKKPPRDNPKYPNSRTVQSAAAVLRRISRKSGALQGPLEAPGSPSHIEVVRAGLPPELAPHLAACLVKPAEIVLFATSAAWAARLRVAAAEAADRGEYARLCAGGPPRITVRVTPANPGR